MNKQFFSKKWLITGGAGYLATNIIENLKIANCLIKRLDRPSAKFSPLNSVVQVEDLVVDIRDRNIWHHMLDKIDVVLHLAAQTSIYIANDNPYSDLEVNFLPLVYMLETCRQAGYCPVVILSGTATETGLPKSLPVDETHPDNPITVYDLHKWIAENYLKYYARQGLVKGAVLRLANVYGPGPNSDNLDRGVLNIMIRKALKGEVLTIYGTGNYIRDYIYVGDVVSAFIDAIENIDSINGQHFFIGSGHGVTISDAVNLVADRVALKTGKRPPVIHINPPEHLSLIENRDFIANTTRFNNATGWQSIVSLTEGIDLTIDCFLRH